MRRTGSAWVLAVTLLATPARGDEQPAQPDSEPDVRPSDSLYDWHAGLNLRTEFGTHPIRIDGGVRFDALDLILVLDPMCWTDGQVDVDLFMDVHLGDGWSTFWGWRSTSIGLADGRQWQQKSILGMAARLPELADGHIRGQVGLELAILWYKAGGGQSTAPISFESARHFSDHINMGMFLRMEYASPW